MKLGAARDQCRKAWRLVVVEVAAGGAAFGYRLDRRKLWRARSREGWYLLCTNLVEEDPAKLWKPLSAAGHDRSGLQEPQRRPRDPADLFSFHQARIEARVFDRLSGLLPGRDAGAPLLRRGPGVVPLVAAAIAHAARGRCATLVPKTLSLDTPSVTTTCCS